MNFSNYQSALHQLASIVKPDASRPVESHLLFCPDFILAISYQPQSSGYVIARLNLRKKDKQAYLEEFKITNLDKIFGIPVDAKNFFKSNKRLEISVKDDKAVIYSDSTKSTILTTPMESFQLPECTSDEFWPTTYDFMDEATIHEALPAMKAKDAIDGPMILSKFLFTEEGYIYTMNNTRAVEVDFGENAPTNFAIPTKTVSFFKMFQPTHVSKQDDFIFWKNKTTGIEFCMPYQLPVTDSFSPASYFEVDLEECDCYSKGSFSMKDFHEAIKKSQTFARSEIDAAKFSACLTIAPNQIRIISNNEKGQSETTVHGGFHTDEDITLYVNPQDLMDAADGAEQFGLVFNPEEHSYLIFMYPEGKRWLRQIVLVEIEK